MIGRNELFAKYAVLHKQNLSTNLVPERRADLKRPPTPIPLLLATISGQLHFPAPTFPKRMYLTEMHSRQRLRLYTV
jgi:hypothetical protein